MFQPQRFSVLNYAKPQAGSTPTGEPFTNRPSLVNRVKRQAAASSAVAIDALESRTLFSTVFSAAAGLSPTHNPNGPWAYGDSATKGAAFVPYPVEAGAYNNPEFVSWSIPSAPEGVPAIFENESSATINEPDNIPITPGQLAAGPGLNGQYSVIQFTTPAVASYSVMVSFEGQQMSHQTTDVHVLYNGKSLFDGLVSGFGNASMIGTSLTINNVAKGAKDRFYRGSG